MTVVINGKCATPDGACHWIDEISAIGPGGHLIAAEEHRYGAIPAATISVTQPRIPLNWKHGEEIGQVVCIERSSDDGSLWATAISTRNMVYALDPAPKFSIEVNGNGVLKALALTDDPAMICLGAVSMIPGDLADAIRETQPWPHQRGVHRRLTRALEYHRARRPGEPIQIVGVDDGPPPTTHARTNVEPNERRRAPSVYADKPPPGPAIYRPGVIVSVGGRPVRGGLSIANYNDEMRRRQRAGVL